MFLNASRIFTRPEALQMYLLCAAIAKLDKCAFPAVWLPPTPSPAASQRWQECADMSGDSDKWALCFILLSFLLLSGVMKMKKQQ